MNKNKVIVVTGGTSEIGEAVALAFAKEGSNVVIIGRNEAAGNAVCSRSEVLAGNIEFIRCDVTNTDDIGKLSKIIEEKYKRVDLLFNSAGMIPESKEIERITEKEWKQTFEVNLDGAFLVTRALKPLIFKCKGCIINNAWIAGMQSYIAGKSYAFSASKSALIQLTRQMALNYAEEGVRVNTIAPSIINTKILGDRDRTEYAKRVPLGYIAETEVVADTVLFLASDAARYITGAVIPVDGGIASIGKSICSVDEKITEKIRNEINRLPWDDNIQSFFGKTIFITGVTGFIGYYFVQILMWLNDYFSCEIKIVMSVRNYLKAKGIFGSLLSRKDVYITIQDLNDGIIDVFDRIDCIVHLANTSETRALKENPSKNLVNAIDGMRNILSFAHQKSVDVMLYMSSITVYGDDIKKSIIKESDSFAYDWKVSSSGYINVKRMNEFLLFDSVNNASVNGVIIRPGYVYGYNPFDDKRIYAESIKNALRNEDNEINSSGFAYRDSIYVIDLIRAIIVLIAHGKIGEAYNVSGGAVSLREYVDTICKITNTNATYGKGEAGEKMQRIEYCTDKIKEIGWQKMYDLNDAIQSAISIGRTMI